MTERGDIVSRPVPTEPIELVRADLPAGVRGVFTTRRGGVSRHPYDGLNLGGHVEDDPRHVMANRDLLARELGAPWLNFPQQVHGSQVTVVDTELAGRRSFRRGQVPELPAPDTDALVTHCPGIPVGVLVADCLPVLLADPVAQVVGAAHAGRRGLAAGVLETTVAAMQLFGADPGRMAAVIGPAICGRCYEVPAEMRDEVDRAVPGSATTTSAGSPGLDLPAGAAGVLRRLGVVEVSSIGWCTAEDPRLFSYRRDGRTGRFAGIVIIDGDG